jgi:predicted Zn-ribbon and HTH transcriptional regulator
MRMTAPWARYTIVKEALERFFLAKAACRLAKFFMTVSELSQPSRVPEAKPSSIALARHSKYDRCSVNAARAIA